MPLVREAAAPAVLWIDSVLELWHECQRFLELLFKVLLDLLSHFADLCFSDGPFFNQFGLV